VGAALSCEGTRFLRLLVAWGQEFLARYCALPGARLELRSGAAAEHVVKVAGTEQADMIALAWSQRLEPGRGLVVRRAVPDTRCR
jgi:hypothetical protein